MLAGKFMQTHELKIWPEFFEPIMTGEKTFELRWDDKGFRAGDALWLREWMQRDGVYTGREITKRVTYLLGGFGLERGYVCMALGDLPANDQHKAQRFLLSP